MLRFELHLRPGSTWYNYPSDPSYAGLPCLLTESGCFHAGPRHYTTRDEKPSLLIIYTLHGQGTLTYMGNKYKLTPASLLFMDCREFHDYRASSSDGWSYRFLHFEGEGVGFYKKQLCTPLTVLHPKDTGQIDRYFAEIDRLADDDSLSAVARRSNMVVSILWRLLDARSEDLVNTASLRADMRNVRAYIQANLAGDLSLESLLDVAHLSKYHFIRVFKAQFGMSPGKYILQSRISAAKRLLVTTSLSIREIALCVGFNDTPGFYRAFKKIEGVSPGQMRENSLLCEDLES